MHTARRRQHNNIINNTLNHQNNGRKRKSISNNEGGRLALNAGKIAELSGLDRKEVDAAMKQMKAEGAIVSPIRCKWAPAE